LALRSDDQQLLAPGTTVARSAGMPSLGHLAVGIAAGRLHAGEEGPRLAATAAFVGLAAFPDLDVLAGRLGAGPGSDWLHRGASHSLAVAAVAALLVTLAADGLGRSRWRMLLTAALVAASHGLLDAFTRGGSGIMLLWPASAARFLAQWTPIPASPFLPRFLSARGLEVLLFEALVFAPFLVYGLWPRRRLVLEPGPLGPVRPAPAVLTPVPGRWRAQAPRSP
jgi:inner membrane protein